MRQDYRVVFDLDGTLYHFDGDAARTFTQSTFYADLKQRIVSFFVDALGMDENTARTEIQRIAAAYQGEMSVGVEREYGMSRNAYFAATWDCDPGKYITADGRLSDLLAGVAGRGALLTAAPRVWADRVLAYLGVADVFGDWVYTGESDIRKPHTAAFQAVAGDFGVAPARLISIGDQNHSDILPAKALGMKTLLVGVRKQDADYCAPTIYDAIQLLSQEGLL
jgi:putative hydrolase of the HAD superfamily